MSENIERLSIEASLVGLVRLDLESSALADAFITAARLRWRLDGAPPGARAQAVERFPLDVLTPEPPDWMTNDRSREDWKAAHALRSVLISNPDGVE